MAEETEFLTHQLQSGAFVVGQPMAAVESAALGIAVNVGARDESAGDYGISHFTEQLLYRGTASMDARELSDRFDSLGISYDSSSGIEMTMLTAVMLGDRIPTAVELLGDVLRHPSLPADAVDVVRGLIRQERRQREDHVAQKVLEEVRQEFYRGSALAHDVLGTPETIDTITRDDIVRFWGQYYTAHNVLFSVAGNFDWPHLIDQLERMTQSWPSGGEPRQFPPPPTAAGIRVLAKDIEQENVAMAFPGVPMGDPRYYTAAVIAQAFGGGMNSRLFREVREKRGLAYTVMARLDGLSQTGFFRIYVGTSADRAHESIDVIRAQIDELVRNGLQAEELALAKTRLKSSQVMRSESTAGRMMTNLRSWWFERKLRSPQEVEQLIDRVSLEHVKELLDVLNINQNLAIVALGPRTADELFGSVLAGH